MAQKWYQKASVQTAIVTGVFLLIIAIIQIIINLGVIKKLEKENSDKIAEIQRLETQLTPFKTIALEKYTGSEQERLQKLAERIQELENPLKKSIASAEAQVEVTIKSDEKVSTRYMDVGGLLCFVKNRQPLLLMSDTQSDAKQNGKGEVIYIGVFRMQSNYSAVGKPIEILQESDIIQVRFVKIPENSQVISGKAFVIVNGDTRFEFEISPQQMQGNDIVIRDIKNKFLTNSSRGLDL
ncbi:MAG: hypothetical protein NTW18_03395 [Candidatus Omnitrophica bacterium]|nr:hypothetical protein [Candidatus Omnitrophota bacterium]